MFAPHPLFPSSLFPPPSTIYPISCFTNSPSPHLSFFFQSSLIFLFPPLDPSLFLVSHCYLDCMHPRRTKWSAFYFLFCSLCVVNVMFLPPEGKKEKMLTVFNSGAEISLVCLQADFYSLKGDVKHVHV